jgi:transposase-like protein
MTRRYTQQQKEEILQQLDDNFGNVTLTAIQTGIPKRTIYDWKQQRKLLALKNGEPVPGQLPPKKNSVWRRQSAANPEQAETHDDGNPPNEYARIRERLMEHLDTLIETLTDDPDTAHLRISALSRLLDRVIKLEDLARTAGPQKVIFEYKYPDGTIHGKPMWETEAGRRRMYEVYNADFIERIYARRPEDWQKNSERDLQYIKERANMSRSHDQVDSERELPVNDSVADT